MSGGIISVKRCILLFSSSPLLLFSSSPLSLHVLGRELHSLRAECDSLPVKCSYVSFPRRVSRESADLVPPADRPQPGHVQPRARKPGGRTAPPDPDPPGGEEPLRTGERCRGSHRSHGGFFNLPSQKVFPLAPCRYFCTWQCFSVPLILRGSLSCIMKHKYDINGPLWSLQV